MVLETCRSFGQLMIQAEASRAARILRIDLLAWRDARIERAELGYGRTSIGEEVDFVIEAAGKLLPIEVKSKTRPRLADATHLRTVRAEYGNKARAGLLLHTGSTLEWLAPDVLAARGGWSIDKPPSKQHPDDQHEGFWVAKTGGDSMVSDFAEV